jgi:hypothetical protein
VSDVAASAALTPPGPPPAAASSEHLGRSMWSHGSFSFKDLIDIVNPLQHLPVIGSIYRYLTGDEPSVGTRVIGDALYGGPIGFGVSVVTNALLTNESGQDLGEWLLANVFGPRDDSPTLGTPKLATADSQAATPLPKPPGAGALAARGMAAASAPLSLPPQSSPMPLVATPAQPVAMNQLFRSAAPPPSTPEQSFKSQASQFQRQASQARGGNRPVPLELSSNLLPVMPAGGHLMLGTGTPPEPGQAQGAKSPADQNAIAQKMMDALNKYEQLKKLEQQRDNAEKPEPKLDLSL